MSTTTKPTKKLYIGASLYKESVCLNKIKKILLQGWTEKVKSFKPEYGTAFHKFCAAYRAGVSVAKSQMLAINYYSKPAIQSQIGEDFRNSGHLFNCTFGYAGKYNIERDYIKLLLDTNKNPLTEMQFKYPYMEEEINGVVYEIILSGTIDSLNEHDKHPAPVIVDIKTTSSWDYKDYLAGYRISPQLKFYKFIAERVGAMYPATFGMFSKDVGCMIDGVFLKKDGQLFERSELLLFTGREMNEFENNLRGFIARLLQAIRENTFPHNEVACDMFPFGLDSKTGCKFKKCCQSGHGIDDEEQVEELEQAYLERDFIKGEYDPMHNQD